MLETLIVLGVLSLITIIFTYRPANNWQRSTEMRMFFDELTAELNFAQEVAIVSGQIVFVRFSTGQNQVQITYPSETFPTQMIVPPHQVTIHSNLSFYYNRHGRVNQFGTVPIVDQVSQRRYELVFQLGSGKFEIK